jgi:hypothetical protein
MMLSKAPGARAAGDVPFTARQVERMFPRIITNTLFARRSDGSWSYTYTVLTEDGKRREKLVYADLAALTAIDAEPVTQSIMTHYISAAEFPIYAAAGFKSCDGSENAPGLQHSTMLGYSVVREVIKETNDTETRFVAPALDCYPLQSNLVASGGYNRVKVTRIDVGEPAPSLFAPPAGYVERSPSQIQDLYAERIPGARMFRDDELPRLQERYRLNHLAQR